MERKVRIIRLWLLTALVVALGCWEPALWFGVPLFFFPNCTCCGPGACSVCTAGTTPREMQVEISGVTDGTCSECEAFNATWVMTTNPNNTCGWLADSTTCGLTLSCDLLAQLGFAVLNVRAGAGSDQRIGWQLILGSSPTNCTLIDSESVPEAGSDGDCTITASTCIVSDIP